jgi:hypothetical protein
MDAIQSNRIKNKVEYENAATEACNRHDYAVAQALLIKALNVAKTSGQLDARLIHLVHTLAATHCLERRYEEAEHLYRQGLAAREKILGSSHPDVADSLARLAVVVTETHGRAAAMALAFRAHCLNMELLPGKSGKLAS